SLHDVGCPNDLQLRLGQVSRNVRDAVGEQPDAPVRDWDVEEDCGGVVAQQALRRLAGIRGGGRDVDLPGDADGGAAGPAPRAAEGVAYVAGDLPELELQVMCALPHRRALAQMSAGATSPLRGLSPPRWPQLSQSGSAAASR